MFLYCPSVDRPKTLPLRSYKAPKASSTIGPGSIRPSAITEQPMRERENEPLTKQRRLERLDQYRRGLDTGDLELIGSVLLSAQADPALDELIKAVNAKLHEELMAADEEEHDP